MMLDNDNRMNVAELPNDALTDYVEALGVVLDTLAVFGSERGSKYVRMTARCESIALMRFEACQEMTKRGMEW